MERRHCSTRSPPCRPSPVLVSINFLAHIRVGRGSDCREDGCLTSNPIAMFASIVNYNYSVDVFESGIGFEIPPETIPTRACSMVTVSLGKLFHHLAVNRKLSCLPLLIRCSMFLKSHKLSFFATICWDLRRGRKTLTQKKI